MTADNFERVLVEILRREPFQPFFVEFSDGRLVQVDKRVAMGGGGAVCITSQDEFFEFNCEEVRDIRLVPHQVIS